MINTMPSSQTGQSGPASPRFKGEVLNQIYRVWLFRKLLPVLIIEIAVFSFVLYELVHAVFIQRVIENALNVFSKTPAGVFPFFVSAFLNTSVLTKLLIVAVIVALAFLIRHLTQGVLRFILVRQNYFSRVK